jgi:hypothetical protein
MKSLPIFVLFLVIIALPPMLLAVAWLLGLA